MARDEVQKLLAEATPGPWVYVEQVSPDGQEFMGCGVSIDGYDCVWMETSPEDNIPNARIRAAAIRARGTTHD